MKRSVREKEVIEEVRRETNAVSRQVLSEDIVFKSFLKQNRVSPALTVTGVTTQGGCFTILEQSMRVDWIDVPVQTALPDDAHARNIVE